MHQPHQAFDDNDRKLTIMRLQSKHEVDSSVILVLAMLRHLESRCDPEDQLPTQILLRDLSKKLLSSPELKVNYGLGADRERDR